MTDSEIHQSLRRIPDTVADTFNNLPLWIILLIFLFSALVIATAGIRLAREADRLADATGMGEALFGAILLGGSTSLPGIVTSVSTAYQGYAQLSISNALGGIAVQTAFLSIADISYRKANLEHAAASLENLMLTAMLAVMLAIPLIGLATPQLTLGHVHLSTPAMLLFYGFALRLISVSREAPLWYAHRTRETKPDLPDQASKALRGRALAGTWLLFSLLALIVALAGYLVGQSGIALVSHAGMSETLVGGILTAIATSLPELVTALAAVRCGALTLAVGNIIGGNCFDMLFIAFADLSFLSGSVYQHIGPDQLLMTAACQLMMGVLMLGLLKRERSGIWNIGFESLLVLLIYLLTFILLILA